MMRKTVPALCCLTLLCCVPPLQAAPFEQASAQAVVDYAPDDSDFANPERGFYHQLDCSSGPLVPAQLRRYRSERRDSLVMCAFLLPEAIDAPIGAAKLALLQRQFDLVRAAGLKMVLRFAYNYSDNALDAAPARTLQHLEQLQPLLEVNRDVLAVLQAGFIGSWGEWARSVHYGGSDGGEPSAANWSDRKALLDKLLQVMPVQRMVQLRTPELKYRLVGAQPAAAEDVAAALPAARVGHHNDCFLASATDWGTYRLLSPAGPAWLAADSAHVAVGGETCHPNPPRSDCASALAELARFHWSYLNGDFHAQVLDAWRAGGCHDAIRRRLGYRLVLEHGIYQEQARPGGPMRILITLKNEGFAAPFNPRALELVLRNASGSYRIALDADPRQWQPQRTLALRQTLTLPEAIPPGDYALLLHLPDPEPALRDRPEYAIRLANAGAWEAQTGLNRLNASVKVVAR
jgi:hypothetical protein